MRTHKLFDEVESIDGTKIFEIEFEVSGRFRPADFWNPAEYPDLEVITIKEQPGKKVVEMEEFEAATGLSQEDLEARLQDLYDDYIEDTWADEQERRAEARAERDY